MKPNNFCVEIAVKAGRSTELSVREIINVEVNTRHSAEDEKHGFRRFVLFDHKLML